MSLGWARSRSPNNKVPYIHTLHVCRAMTLEYILVSRLCVCVQPNGRFALHQKICLSASSYHPELWQPSWSSKRSSLPHFTITYSHTHTHARMHARTHTHTHTHTHCVVRTVLLAIIGFMPTEGVGAVGALDCSTSERKRMAKRWAYWIQ